MTFISISFWQWWVLACILLGMEVLMPGTFLLWIGVAAGVTGLVVWLAQDVISAELQLVCFAVLSVLGTIVWKRFFRKSLRQSDEPHMNDRVKQHIGREYVLMNGIEFGRGTLNINDTIWKVEGPDMPAGTRVKVVGAEGAILKVRKVESNG